MLINISQLYYADVALHSMAEYLAWYLYMFTVKTKNNVILNIKFDTI